MPDARQQKKICNFTDLEAWRTSHALILMIYRNTKLFPKDELFCLTSQMRRSAISISSNIAEGFGRRTFADKKQFYTIASGSIAELQSQLILARDLGYMESSIFREVFLKSVSAYKLLNALIARTHQ